MGTSPLLPQDRTASLVSIAEQLNDLLWASTNLPKALRDGLHHLLSVLDVPGGELLVQTPQEERPYYHIAANSPSIWGDLMARRHLDALARMALKEEKVAPGDATLNLGAVVPLFSPQGIQGVMLLAGRVLNDGEMEILPVLSRAFGRRIAVERTWLGLPGGRRGIIKALTAINATHAMLQDLETVELLIAEAARELLGASWVALYLLENGGSDLAVRKVANRSGGWQSIQSLHLTRGLVAESVRRRTPIFSPHAGEDPLFDPQIDGVNGQGDNSIAVFPAIVDRQVQGAILIGGSPGKAMSDEESRWLMSLGGTWAYAVHTVRLINALRVANANLEVNRWQLVNSRNTLRALFDSLPNGIYIVDQDYTVIAANKSRATRVGKHPSELAGKTCFAVLFGRSQPCSGCKVAETFLEGQSTTRTLSESLPDGNVLEWEIVTHPIQGDDGLVNKVILIENDITERRRMEARIIQSEKLAAVGQLAAGVAHEINNPLSAILANVQLLRRDLRDEDEDVQESLRLIEIASTRAVQVVQNLLSFARKDRGGFTWVSLNDVLQKALTLLQHEILAHGVQVETDFAEDLPEILGNVENLESVWVNLMLNAIDAMPRGEGRLVIRSRHEGDEIRVTIRDNGAGIRQEHLPHIFEPFFTTKDPGKGTGLGLSLCYQIVRQHGGTIQVSSQPGEGSEFVVVLPVTPARA